MGPATSGTSARDKPGGPPSSGLAIRTTRSSSSSKSIFCETVDTSGSTEDTTANLKQKTVTMALKVMLCEERNIFFGEMIRAGLGTREVENFIANQEYLRRGDSDNVLGERERLTILEREREMVGKAMENKLTDSLAEGVKKRLEVNNLKERL